uniref:Uncharacterized protein n=1 Tax=Timema monikensis TaxID=170555 RepID=A0A7R9EA51_9NEOP|nr:unnamed protein product [Timema monikensis]
MCVAAYSFIRYPYRDHVQGFVCSVVDHHGMKMDLSLLLILWFMLHVDSRTIDSSWTKLCPVNCTCNPNSQEVTCSVSLLAGIFLGWYLSGNVFSSNDNNIGESDEDDQALNHEDQERLANVLVVLSPTAEDGEIEVRISVGYKSNEAHYRSPQQSVGNSLTQVSMMSQLLVD